MYRKVGGINQLEAGYHRFYVKPQFVRGIEEARTELSSRSWLMSDSQLRCQLS